MSDPTDRADRFTWKAGEIVWTKPPAGHNFPAGDPGEPPLTPHEGSCDDDHRQADTTPAARPFRHLTPENWRLPDPTSAQFVRDADKWAALILEIDLDADVPAPVRDNFEIARGLAAYAHFFYPFHMLAIEHLGRVAEVAARIRCEQLGRRKLASFKGNIAWLAAEGYISTDQRGWWDTALHFRNTGSHLADYRAIPPAVVHNVVESGAAAINDLVRDSSATHPRE